jgi:prefoldin subunit 5
MNDRGPNDLEKTIERLERRVEELKKDNDTLIKEIYRLSEYNNKL